MAEILGDVTANVRFPPKTDTRGGFGLAFAGLALTAR